MNNEMAAPRIGDIWRDRDKRMYSGYRRVKVTLVAFGRVTYQQVIGSNDDIVSERLFSSKADRFRRSFEPVSHAAG